MNVGKIVCESEKENDAIGLAEAANIHLHKENPDDLNVDSTVGESQQDNDKEGPTATEHGQPHEDLRVDNMGYSLQSF